MLKVRGKRSYRAGRYQVLFGVVLLSLVEAVTVAVSAGAMSIPALVASSNQRIPRPFVASVCHPGAKSVEENDQIDQHDGDGQHDGRFHGFVYEVLVDRDHDDGEANENA